MDTYEGGTPHPPRPDVGSVMINRGRVQPAADVSAGQITNSVITSPISVRGETPDHYVPTVKQPEAEEPTFVLRTPRGAMGPGAQLSIEFPGGEGVSGILAGVDIAAGGTPFSIVCTHDGKWPDARPETPAEAATGDAGEHAPDSIVSIRLSDLRAMREDRNRDSQRVAALRTEAQELRSQVERLQTELRAAIEKHATLKVRPSAGVTQIINAAPEYPRQRVVTEHGEDGSVTIRVELRKGNQ